MQNNVKQLPINELRRIWRSAWKRNPAPRIGRAMLEKSLAYKINESGKGGLKTEYQKQLEELIKLYKKNPEKIELTRILKPGTQLVRLYGGKKYIVRVTSEGFDYNGVLYKSVSKIANEITGSKWNGYVFFGLKKVDAGA